MLYVFLIIVFVILSDVVYGLKVYFVEFSEELKCEGIIDEDLMIDFILDLLDVVSGVLGVMV